MVARRPLVNISGQTTELPPSDSVIGGSVGSLTAGSGLNGGGSLANSVSVDVSLAPNPSGLIFVGGKLGVDGAVRSIATTALASGNFALATAPVAIASGTAGSALAATAQASGNAALAAIAAIPGGSISSFTAASAVASGYAVGLDDTGRVQSVRTVGAVVAPTISSRNNFIGIAQSTVTSGSAVRVRLPGSYDQNNTGLTPGAVYYVNPTTSGFTTIATQPSAWSGAVNWGPIGRAVNSTTLLLTDMI